MAATEIVTEEGLAALPVGSVLRTRFGYPVPIVESSAIRAGDGHLITFDAAIDWFAPLTLLHRPDWPSQAEAVRAIQAALDTLDGAGCIFFACRGPDEEPEDMATCRICWTVHDLRAALKGEQPPPEPVAEHALVPKPRGGGGGHTPGVGWMCTGCGWRFSYDVPEARAREVWLSDDRHALEEGA